MTSVGSSDRIAIREKPVWAKNARTEKSLCAKNAHMVSYDKMAYIVIHNMPKYLE